MKDYRSEGLIIRVRDYNESDRIVTIFTREYGKVQAIAKGCRKQKSRSRGIIQLFTYADFALYKGRNLDTITQCEAKESFTDIRNDLERLAYASYICELLDGFVTSGEKHDDLFYLALICLHLLTVEEPQLLTWAFELKLMDVLGYRPHLENCVLCGNSLTGNRVAFSSAHGGAICKECAVGSCEYVECSVGTVKMLEQLSKRDLTKLKVLKVTPEAKKEINQIMKSYIGQRLDKKLKSAEFLDSLTTIQNIG